MTKLNTETIGGEPYKYYPLGKHVVRAIGICGGRPTFKYTRIEITGALERLAAGESLDEIVTGYKGRVSREAILEAGQIVTEQLTSELYERSQSNLLPPRGEFHGLARRGPPANNERNAAAPEDAQHDAAPAVISARRFDHADAVAISAGNFDRAWHTWQLDRDFAFGVDAPAPLIQLRPDPIGIIVVSISAVSIVLVSIRGIGQAASIERVVVTSAARRVIVVAIRFAIHIAALTQIRVVGRGVVLASRAAVAFFARPL